MRYWLKFQNIEYLGIAIQSLKPKAIKGKIVPKHYHPGTALHRAKNSSEIHDWLTDGLSKIHKKKLEVHPVSNRNLQLQAC